MMPAGKYYIGDLCYCMHEEWDEVCGITIEGDGCLDGEFNLASGVRFCLYRTYWGDGTYFDQDSYEYGVDSGLLGCIKVDDVDVDNERNSFDGGRIVEFEQPFEVSEEDGVIKFGNKVIIDTMSDNDAWYNQEDEDEDE